MDMDINQAPNQFVPGTIEQLSILNCEMRSFVADAMNALSADDANEFDNAMSNIAIAIERSGVLRRR